MSFLRGMSILVLVLGMSSFAQGEDYASKLTLRTGFGQFVNNGSIGGSTAGVGGFNLQYHHFLNAFLSAGVGYMAQFDMNSKGIPVAGLEIIGRAYFLKEGTVVTTAGSWGSYTVHHTYSPYIVGLYGKRQFYLGEDLKSSDPTKQLSGEFGVVNGGLGVDYSLDRNFEINAEFSTSLMSFASTDPRVQIAENMLWIGLNYAF